MEAHKRTLEFLREAGHDYIVVPFFQRRYVWTKSNWEEMFRSLKNTADVPFLGTIITKYTPDNSEYRNGSYIIDGQQRLTTISLMFKALYDTLTIDYSDNTQLLPFLLSHILTTQRAGDPYDETASVKLVQSLLENETYERVIMENIKYKGADIKYIDRFDSIDLENDSDEELLVRCYAYFRQEFCKLSYDELKEFYSQISDNQYYCLVEIQLDRDEKNEQAIFDTINRAGIHLSISDIIKNNIFQKYFERNNSMKRGKKSEGEIIEYYRERWETPFFDKSLENIWDEKQSFGNNQRTNLDFLLYCVAMNNWRNEENLFEDLANIYKRQIDDMSIDDIENLIEQISDFRREYYEIILDIQKKYRGEKEFSYPEFVSRLFLVLEVCGVKMFHPYLIKRLVELRNCTDEDTYNRIKEEFWVIESFVLRRRISPKGTHDYTEKCVSMLEDNSVLVLLKELEGKDASGNIADTKIQDGDIADYVGSIKVNNAKLILFVIELYKMRDDESAHRSLHYIYELEHIMPQKWKTNWSGVEIKKEDGSDWKDEDGNKVSITTDEGCRVRDKIISSLGNMTLLTKKLNVEISNGNFKDKIEGKIDAKGKELPGIRKSGKQLLITEEIVAKYDAGDTLWDEGHIIKREKELATTIIEVWPSRFDSTILTK